MLEVAILAFFAAYGALEQTLIQPKLNLTVCGASEMQPAPTPRRLEPFDALPLIALLLF